MIVLYLPKDRLDNLLKEAGYYYHPTRGKDGLTVWGYVRDDGSWIRWHAIPNIEGVTIHMDEIGHGWHRTKVWQRTEKNERMRILSLYGRMYPNADNPLNDPEKTKIKMKVRDRGEFAPNLREIQRQHKTAIQNQETASTISHSELSPTDPLQMPAS